MAERASGMAGPAVGCLAAALGLLYLVLPRGFALGGAPLDPPVQLALMGAALALGAWTAFSGQETRVFLGALGAALLVSPAYDPRAPLDRLPAYLAVAALFLLYVEFALLHAKVTRLSKLPRAHLTQVGKAREVELSATAARIAGSWPVPLGMALGLVALCLGLQAALAGALPPQVGQSLEMRGPFGLGLVGAAVLGGLGAYVALVRIPKERAAAPARADEPAAAPPGAPGAPDGAGEGAGDASPAPAGSPR